MRLEHFDPSANFWKLNPSFTGVWPDLYKNDKSRGKQNSSRILWGVMMLHVPDERNQYYGMPWSDRLHEVVHHYWGEEYYNKIKSQVESLGEDVQRLMLTDNRKLYDTIRYKMDELSQFLRDQSFTIQNAESLTKIMKEQHNVFKMLDNIKKIVDAEEAQKGTVRGDVELSGLESGDI
jgi:hypothetical protein